MSGPPDEFDWITSLRPLTRGDPRAVGLMDDAAILPCRPGYDLVISKDAMVEGVHVLPGEAPDIIARRLIRTNLSDLAAKAAEPFGYFLMTAFPPAYDQAARDAFARGLAEDGEEFAISLLGGDTVSTTGPLTVAATVLGWAPSGRAVLRSGARDGDALVVCGAVGDGWLGLKAARGEVTDPEGRLASHYRLPRPLLALRLALRTYAHAAVDISDGLLADAGHIAHASGLGLTIDLERLPLSPAASAWCAVQADPLLGRLSLAAGGDDYAIACAIAWDEVDAFINAASRGVEPIGVVGRFDTALGARVTFENRRVETQRLGWRH
jgi:thiamine-monophosphate kinase